VKIISAMVANGLAALGGGFAVFGGYDDSPGAQLLGLVIVLGAMAVSAKTAARTAQP
jgi:hypothetical protein